MAYCSKCGKLIDDGSAYCPGCGTAVPGQAGNNDPNWTSSYGPNSGPSGGSQQGTADLGGTLTIILVFGLLWMVGSLIYGAACFAGAGYYMSALDTTVVTIGVMSVLSGIFALLTCIFIFMRKNHTLALIFCFIGSAIALIFVIGVVGLFFAFMLSKEKHRFTS